MNKFLTLIVFFISIASARAQFNYGWYTEGENNIPKKRISFTVTNSLDIPLDKHGIVIKRTDLPEQNIAEQSVALIDPKLPPNGEASSEELKKIGGYLMRKETNGHAINVQLDDIDDDGIWDELFFVTDLAPKETREFYIYIDPYERGLYEHKVHTGIGKYGRHTVPFIETEHIGWKLWFPHSLDVHGKRAPMLVANYEYTTNKSGYYMPQEMGSDIMTVASTFGGGTMSLFENPDDPENPSRAYFSPFKGQGPLKDTRYVHRVVYNGPLRSMFKVTTTNWNSGKGSYELEQYYQVMADKSWATVQVKFNKFQPVNKNTVFGAGIRHIMQEYKSINKDGMAISMGKDVIIRIPDEDIGDAGMVLPWEGIAMVVKDQYKPKYFDIKSNLGNHIFEIPVTKDLSYEYMVFAGWSLGEVRNNEKDFVEYVETEKKKYNSPPVVKIFKYELKDQK